MAKVIQMQKPSKRGEEPEKLNFTYHVGQAAEICTATWRLFDFMRAQQRGQIHVAELFAEQDGEFLLDLPANKTAEWFSRIAVAVFLGAVIEEYFVFSMPVSTVRFIELHGEEINTRPTAERMTELMSEFLPTITVTA